MEGKQILTAVKLTPSQRANVERWAAISGSNVSTVLRSLVDGMATTETILFVAKSDAEPAQSERHTPEMVTQ